MKVLSQSIIRDDSGTVTMLPDEPEDMWFAYNLIRPTDTLHARTVRKVKKETATGTSATSTHTVHTTLVLAVLSTSYDAGAAHLRVSGRVAAENKFVAVGQHHTLELGVGQQFALGKGAGGWDAVAREQLREAADPRRAARVYAVVMQEGLANVCSLTDHQTVFRTRVEGAIAGKRGGGGEAHEKSVARFFETLLATLLRFIEVPGAGAGGGSGGGGGGGGGGGEPEKVAPLLLASPGFTATAFQKYMLDYAIKNNDKALAAYARDNVIVAHSSTGHMHSLGQVLAAPHVLAKLSDTKYARETALMDKFGELLRADDGRAWYGPKEIEKAVAKGAVGRGGGVLLISNKLFRSQNVDERRKWVDLVERVRVREGGEVRVLSSEHESGKRLEALGDVAAILTFPLFDLDDSDGEDEQGEYETMFGEASNTHNADGRADVEQL